jgi:hypothetical protein
MSEYLRAVAEGAPVGLLDGAALRAFDPGQAIQRVQQVKGLGSARSPPSWSWSISGAFVWLGRR